MKTMRKYLPYFLLVVACMLPLLAPGYILTLDLIFTPELRMPDAITNDYLWHVLLFLLDQILPSQIIEKALLAGIFLLSAIGIHRLLEHIIKKELATKGLSWHWPLYIASIFYAVNPFTYSRFMTGQYAVLLGYALIPFFARALLQFLITPARGTLLKLIAFTLAISIVSIHTLGSVLVLSVILTGATLWQYRRRADLLKGYLLLGIAGIGICLLASSYWLVPLALGQGETAHMIQEFDEAHDEAFATTGPNIVLQTINVLKLQGFWAEGRSLFVMPQDHLPGWGTIRLLIWALAAGGLIVCWRHARKLAAALTALLVVSILLAIGLPGQLLTDIGYREPQKFAGLIAFVFAISIAFGSARLLYKLKKHSEVKYGLLASTLLLVIILFTPTMYWGFAGQLTPRHYPADWYALNDRLNNDHTSFKVLFVPWHQYMSFDFAGRIIANPAEKFFDKRVLVSNNPELGNIRQSDSNAAKAALNSMLSDKNPTDFGRKLADYDIKYIIMAKEHDYQHYRYLGSLKDLTVAWDSPNLRLYRNTQWKEP